GIPAGVFLGGYEEYPGELLLILQIDVIGRSSVLPEQRREELLVAIPDKLPDLLLARTLNKRGVRITITDMPASGSGSRDRYLSQEPSACLRDRFSDVNGVVAGVAGGEYPVKRIDEDLSAHG